MNTKFQCVEWMTESESTKKKKENREYCSLLPGISTETKHNRLKIDAQVVK